jgi:putative hydrolase of the HAD superfamily
MSVRTVVFDFGNVIGFFSHRKAAQQLARFARRPVEVERIIQFLFFTDLEPRFEVGQVSPAELLAMLRDEFDLAGTDEQLAHAFGDMFTANDHVCDLIPELQGRYRLALLSNTNDLHYRLFRRQFAETLDRFDYLFTSHEVGLRKPDPVLFDYVRSRLGGEASEYVFIDDLPVNIEAAKARGWRGVVYNRGDDLREKLAEAGMTFAAAPVPLSHASGERG